MSRKLETLAAATWVALGGIVGAVSWVLGLKTWSAHDASCTWAQRNAALLFLGSASVSVGVYYLIVRRPPFQIERARARAGFLAGLILAPWFIGLAVSGPNLFGALDRGRQKRSIADMRAWFQLLAEYHEHHGAYPEADSIQDLAAALDARNLPETDAWRNPFVAVSSPSSYTIISCGQCGQLDDNSQDRPTWEASIDIVMTNGKFVQHPLGLNVE